MIMVVIEWKRDYWDWRKRKIMIVLFTDTTGFLRENDLLWRLGW